jgi:ABC-type phosphate/phosphonate transport system substrate-binding protein
MHIQRISASGTCRKIITAAAFTAALLLSLLGAQAETLKIGILKNDYFRGGEQVRPFAEYIQQNTGKAFYDTQIVELESPAVMAQELKKGKLNAAFLSLYPSALMMEHYADSPDLVVSANNSIYVKSSIFVLKESPIKKVGDLKGKRVSFASQYSTGGYYLASRYIAKVIGNGSFKSLYVNGCKEVFTAVFLKKAEAGVTQHTDYEGKLPALYKDAFRTLTETESIPALFFYVRRSPEKNIILQSSLSFKSDKSANETVINNLSPIGFDWKTLCKSILLH